MNRKLHFVFPTVASVTLILLILAGCSSNLTYQAAMDKNRRNISELSKLQDANFLVDVSSYNQLGKRVAELGVERGYSSVLVNLAKEKTEEFNDMEKEINKLARKKKIKVPGQMKAEHKMMYDRLSTSAQAEFDSEFVNILQDVNEEQTGLYEEKSSGADDADVRAFAARNLGFLRRHADEIAKVNDQLMHTYRQR